MFPIDMLWWFYKSVKDTDQNKHDWGTGYAGGYGYGRGGGYGGGGYGGFGESTEEPAEPQLNEEDSEDVEDLEEIVKLEVRGVLAENFKFNNEDE